MKCLSSTVASLLFWANAAIACTGFATRHDIFLPLNGTLAVENQLPLNAAGYAVSNLGRGAYMITDGVYQSFVLVSTAGVVVVDAPPTTGHKLQWAIGNITSTPVRWFVYSHSHADHVGGAYLFANQSNPKVKTVAHANTASQLAERPDPNRPVPQITFKDRYELVAGNQTLELFFPGIGHDLGNIIVYAPKQKVLMMVDQVYAGWVPFESLAASVYVPGWIRGHDQILSYDFDVYLGGHLGGPANRTAVEVQREYVNDVFNNCAAALIKSGTNDPAVGIAALSADVLGNNPNNAWAQFAAYLDTVADLCNNMTSAKWLGRLAGQDIFGYSHAVFYLLVCNRLSAPCWM
ncbi:beta-lactamase-like protein [Lasiosphaeria miniovina]|uniref:Beta-lactamase-like protein n=1 Tax=Lasiosphaeria miniovina TaxID=1954250 RepID=A0AA40E5V9_9PEZI|nr:beta-lactamase-like protein [Lasiosphaeria miniovina]KAK0723588.1 beta-lactamase-like protein [Lasiosphaeria miniovina]